MRSLFMALVLALCLIGCGFDGVSQFDLANTVTNINGGLGEYGYDISYEFDVQPAPTNSLVVLVFWDRTASIKAVGYGLVQQHPTDDYWFVQAAFSRELGYGKYDLNNYVSVLFAKPYQPELPPDVYLDPQQVADIYYTGDHENMVQLRWSLPQYDGFGLPSNVNSGSILEVIHHNADGSENWRNTCHYWPVLSSAMCRMYGIGLGSDPQLTPDRLSIRLVENGPWLMPQP